MKGANDREPHIAPRVESAGHGMVREATGWQRFQQVVRPMQGCLYQASTGLQWHVGCVYFSGNPAEEGATAGFPSMPCE